MNFFGKQIRKERSKANMTLEDVAKKSNINEDVLWEIEQGVLFPNLRQLIVLARVFGKHIGYFFIKLLR